MYSERQINILQSLYPDKVMDRDVLNNLFGLSKGDPVLTRLCSDRLLRIYFDNNTKKETVFLTEQGRAYIQQKTRKDKEQRMRQFHVWANTIIAVFALVVAIIGLFR